MSRVSSLAAIASAFVLAAASTGVYAADKKPAGPNTAKSPPAAATGSDEVSMWVTADRLARYGDEKKDPLALITAARIKKEIGGAEEKRDKKVKGGKGGDVKGAAADMSVDGLLARARAAAGGRADLIALADEVAKSQTKGVLGGPRYTVTVIGGGARDWFTLPFRGGEWAKVAIAGEGYSPLNLHVYDENNRHICTSKTYGDHQSCAWVPSWSGVFRIVVENLGQANRYAMVTN